MDFKKSQITISLSILFLSLILSGCAHQNETRPLPDEGGNATKNSQEPIKVIAHRGARSLAPENTLAAASKALEAGADGWELDVAMSSDGVLIVVHDDTLERTSNAVQVFPDRLTWSVYAFTLAELKQLDLGSWFIENDPFQQIAAGNISVSDLETFKGLKIPTLEEALIFTLDNNWWVNIEIKDATGTSANEIIVSEVVALVEDLKMQEHVLISSFNHDYLRQVKSINPDIATGVLVSKPVLNPVSLMRELDAQAFHPSLKITMAGQVRLLREAGYDVNVWTVNEEKDLLSLIEMGITGIFTDFPQDLMPVVNSLD